MLQDAAGAHTIFRRCQERGEKLQNRRRRRQACALAGPRAATMEAVPSDARSSQRVPPGTPTPCARAVCARGDVSRRHLVSAASARLARFVYLESRCHLLPTLWPLCTHSTTRCPRPTPERRRRPRRPQPLPRRPHRPGALRLGLADVTRCRPTTGSIVEQQWGAIVDGAAPGHCR